MYPQKVMWIAGQIGIAWYSKKDTIQKKANELLATGNFTLNNLSFILKDGKWYNKDLNGSVPLSTSDGQVELFKTVTAILARNELKNTDWYKDNHYTTYQWNQGSYKYEETDKPIYTWMQQSPTNDKYIKRNQPSFRYKSYQIRDEYNNPDYEYLMKFIPVPKKGKFGNPA